MDYVCTKNIELTMERRMTGNCHVRCGVGENPAITSKDYLSLFGQILKFDKLIATIRSREISASIIFSVYSVDGSDEFLWFEAIALMPRAAKKATNEISKYPPATNIIVMPSFAVVCPISSMYGSK